MGSTKHASSVPKATGAQLLWLHCIVVALVLLLSYEAAADESDGGEDGGENDGGEDGGEYGDGSSGINRRDAQLLQELITATTEGGEEWAEHCTGVYPSSMAGTHTYGVCIDSTGNITHLLLHNCNLRGTIPNSIGDMTSLIVIDFTINRLRGTVPASVSKLLRLTKLSFSLNSLSGTLPPSYMLLVNLESLSIQNNQLNGTLPLAMFTGMTKLMSFMLAQNAFSGPLPHLPCSSTGGGALRSFYLNNNQFTGEFPSNWNTCRGLQTIGLSDNKITGTLPDAWSTFTNLSGVVLHNNDLSGTLPNSWGSLSKLTGIFLSGNPRLTGTIPASWVTPEKTKVSWFTIGLCGTRLTGSLPPSWSISAFQFNLECNRTFVPFVPSSSPTVSKRNDDTAIATLTRSASATISATAADDSLDIAVWRVASYTSAATGIAAASVSVLANPVDAVSLRRLSLDFASDCRRSRASVSETFHATNIIDTSNSPTQWMLFLDAGRGASVSGRVAAVSAAHRGAVAGNLLLFSACVVFAGVCVLIAAGFRHHRIVAAKKERTASRRVWSTIVHTAAWMRIPGVLIIPWAMLSQQAVVSSAWLLTNNGSGRSDEAAASVSLGIGGLLLCTAVVCGLWIVLDPRGTRCSQDTHHTPFQFLCFHATARLIPMSLAERRRQGEGFAKKWAHMWCAPTVLWSSGASSSFAENFGLLFRSCADRRHWWLAAEACVTLLLSIVAGVAPASPSPAEPSTWCRSKVWIAFVVALGWAVATILLAPKQRRLAMLTLVVSNGADVIVVLLQAVAFVVDDTDDSSPNIVLLFAISDVLCLVVSAFSLITSAAIVVYNFWSGSGNVAASELRVEHDKDLVTTDLETASRDASSSTGPRCCVLQIEEGHGGTCRSTRQRVILSRLIELICVHQMSAIVSL